MGKLYTLDVTAKILRTTRTEVMNALPKCARDFGTRTIKKLNQAEFDCVKAELQKGKRSPWP